MIGLPWLTSEDHPPCEGNSSLFWDDEYVPDDDHIITAKNIRRSQDAAVRAVCRDCPFRAPCMEWGIEHEKDGWYGGFSPKERDDIRRAWGIKVEVPSVHVYEVGARVV